MDELTFTLTELIHTLSPDRRLSTRVGGFFVGLPTKK